MPWAAEMGPCGREREQQEQVARKKLWFGAQSVVSLISRCVVVLFNPRKHKQHHILNSSR